VAATGALLFATGKDLTALTLARALVGVGVAAGLMAPIKATLSWFASERTAAMTGWIFVLGYTGAITATAPAHWLLQLTHWRGLFALVAALCLLALAALWRFAPEPPAHASLSDARGAWRSFWRIYRQPSFWRVSIVSMTSQAVALGVQTLWAGPWLRDVAQLDRGASANVLLASVFASAVGSFAFGQLGSRLARHGQSPLRALIAGVVMFLLVQIALIAGFSRAPLLLWIVFGFFSTAGSLVFAVITRDFEPSLSGRVLTALNVLIFGLAFVCQWGIGAIIDRWPSSAGHYHPDGYRAGFAVFLALELTALLWFAWVNWRRQFAAA
jgi:predicted MFS family arabinose efflux permease